MDDTQVHKVPKLYSEISRKSEEIGFTMPSDIHIGTLLKTLIASKPGARVLELGSGIGLSLSWMIEGLDRDATLISVDNDTELIDIVSGYFGNDERVSLVCEDGTTWIKSYEGAAFDLIFADAWPGKYSEIEETLRLVKVGGYYVIDDMTAQPNWPEGHELHVARLIDYLQGREDFILTKLNWSTGVLLAVRTAPE